MSMISERVSHRIVFHEEGLKTEIWGKLMRGINKFHLVNTGVELQSEDKISLSDVAGV